MERSTTTSKDRRLGCGPDQRHLQKLPIGKLTFVLKKDGEGCEGYRENVDSMIRGSRNGSITIVLIYLCRFSLQEKSAEYQHIIKEFQERANGVSTYSEADGKRDRLLAFLTRLQQLSSFLTEDHSSLVNSILVSRRFTICSLYILQQCSTSV